jgi:hypothetical protein
LRTIVTESSSEGERLGLIVNTVKGKWYFVAKKQSRVSGLKLLKGNIRDVMVAGIRNAPPLHTPPTKLMH